jgi:hypothetical protein
MAHFAEIDSNNEVIRVLVVSNDDEHRGQELLAEDLDLGGFWVQTSYNHNFRKQYAGIGYTYNEAADVFVTPSPFDSWTLDENHDWQPPTPRPDTGSWSWDENGQEWVEIPAADG